MLNWIKESERYKHLFYAIPVGFFLTFLCVIGLAFGLEFKDKQHGGLWDWSDLIATLIGGAIGQILFLILIWLI